MSYALILLIVAAAGLVLFSLARGLYEFGKQRDELSTGNGPTAGQLMQNKMMFARVKWQAITIILLVVLGMVAAPR